jgi:hypothetical protein
MMRRWATLTLVVAVLCTFAADPTSALAKPSAKDVASATAFMRKIVELKAEGRQGAAYDLVFPAQKALVTRAAYIACQPNGGVTIEGFEVKQVSAETAQIPGTDTKVKTLFITVAITASQGAAKETSTATFHAIRMKRGWAWAMSQSDVDRCSTPSSS